MEKAWNWIEKKINYIDDHYTYGAAEMLFIGGLGAIYAVCIYCAGAAIIWSIIYILSFISGAINA